jgi:hypothetical protein
MALLPAMSLAEPLWVGRFVATDNNLPPPWRIVRLDPNVAPTRYRLREWDGVMAVEAHAVKSMALLARPVEVDLAKTPVLCWRWRIDAPLKNADITRKTGYDSAAHIHLSFAARQGLRPREDAAIMYVWDNRHAVGTWQANVHSGRTRMLVLRSGAADAGRWLEERRNLDADYRHAFGRAPGRLIALGMASDTDDTGEEARAGFADFRFVARDAPC